MPDKPNKPHSEPKPSESDKPKPPPSEIDPLLDNIIEKMGKPSKETRHK